MSKEPTPPPKSEPPRYPEGKGGPTSGHKPGPSGQPHPQNPKAEATGQSQKSQIAQYFRSQGKQPDDVVFETNGMKLRLRDLDG